MKVFFFKQVSETHVFVVSQPDWLMQGEISMYVALYLQ
jgi:hypothetical protein